MAAVTATTPKELGESQLTQSGSKVGDLMWARMPPKHPEVYEKTQVLEVVAGTKVKVKLPSGAVEEYAMTELLPCNTESDLDDVCALTFLSEAAVLDCVRSRFLKKKIYTWVARILIAMNPFERLNIYGDDAKQQYATLDPRAAPPHTRENSAAMSSSEPKHVRHGLRGERSARPTTLFLITHLPY